MILRGIVIKKYGLTMAIYMAISTGLTVLINELVKHKIKDQVIQQQKGFFDQVFSKSFCNKKLQRKCFIIDAPQLGKGKHYVFIASKNGIPIGTIMEVTTPDGYSGIIRILVATDFNRTVLDVRVVEHHETPGLGDKIDHRVSNWILNFTGKVINGPNDPFFAIKKDGGVFDQFTGATITPRAVVNAVKKAVLYAEILPEQINNLPVCKE